jgi:enoyl-CoA hydratase/carnithine racemase
VSADDTVVLDIGDDGVAVVSLNRPDRHNAFTDAMDRRFFDLMDEAAARAAAGEVRCVVWRGEGKSFSSGRDTKELGIRAGGESDLEYIERGHARTRVLYTMPAPVVVALKGWVMGGSFERALLCDLRIAADDARMRLPEVEHGVIPDSAGAARIFQMAGHGLAADLALTGRAIDAQEALRHGLVSRVVPADRLDDDVMEVARAIAGRSPLAVRFATGVIRGLGVPQVERTLHEEKLAQTAVFASDDYAEFKAARVEDRAPKFRGR